MKTKYSRKLLHYSAFATSFMAMQKESDAQIVYSDLEPDSIINFNCPSVQLDLDDNGETDFEIGAWSWYWAEGYGPSGFSVYCEQQNDNEVIITSIPAFTLTSSFSSDTCYFPPNIGIKKLNVSHLIGSDDNWGNGNVMFAGEVCGFYGQFGSWGEWNNTDQDFFIGIKFYNPDLHYGWIRVYNDDDELIKDFAYEATPNTPIQIFMPESFPADSVSNIQIADIGNNGNANDFQVSFAKAENEETISEYRIILVQQYEAEFFTLAQAELLSAESYFSIIPAGIDQVVSLPDWLHCSNGEVPGIYYEYFAYIFCVAKQPNAFSDRLCGPSAESVMLDIYHDTNQNTNLFICEIIYAQNVLKINLDLANKGTVKIYNAQGAILVVEELSSKEMLIPVNYSAGVYFIEVETAGGIVTKNIFVE